MPQQNVHKYHESWWYIFPFAVPFLLCGLAKLLIESISFFPPQLLLGWVTSNMSGLCIWDNLISFSASEINFKKEVNVFWESNLTWVRFCKDLSNSMLVLAIYLSYSGNYSSPFSFPVQFKDSLNVNVFCTLNVFLKLCLHGRASMKRRTESEQRQQNPCHPKAN